MCQFQKKEKNVPPWLQNEEPHDPEIPDTKVRQMSGSESALSLVIVLPIGLSYHTSYDSLHRSLITKSQNKFTSSSP